MEVEGGLVTGLVTTSPGQFGKRRKVYTQGKRPVWNGWHIRPFPAGKEHTGNTSNYEQPLFHNALFTSLLQIRNPYPDCPGPGWDLYCRRVTLPQPSK